MHFIVKQQHAFFFLLCCMMNLLQQQQVQSSGLKAVGQKERGICFTAPYDPPDAVVCERSGIFFYHCSKGFYCANWRRQMFSSFCGWDCVPNGHSIECANGHFCPTGHSCSAHGRQCIPNGAQECGPNGGCGNGQTCENGLCVPKEIEQCQRYLDMEKTVQCGPDGYMRGYGHRYCTWFFERSGLFNPKGQQFIKCAAECLLKKMDAEIMPSSANNCDAIRAKAYASHVGCYKDCDVCATMASRQNIVQYWHTIKLRDIEMGPVAAIAKHCAGQAVQSVYDRANTTAVQVTAYLLSIMPTNTATQ